MQKKPQKTTEPNSRPPRRMKAAALALCMALVIALGAVPARAEEPEAPQEQPPQAVVTLAAFAALAEGTLLQTVPAGTALEALTLPATLEATTVGDETTPAQTVQVENVTWQPAPAYDAALPGDYVFTAALPGGYALAEGVAPPTIAVTVEAAPLDEALGGEAPGAVITLMARQLYVSSSGSDATGDGSQAAPYATLQKAVDMAASGDAIVLLTGAGGATVPNTITALTIRGEGGAQIIAGQLACAGDIDLSLDNVDVAPTATGAHAVVFRGTGASSLSAAGTVGITGAAVASGTGGHGVNAAGSVTINGTPTITGGPSASDGGFGGMGVNAAGSVTIHDTPIIVGGHPTGSFSTGGEGITAGNAVTINGAATIKGGQGGGALPISQTAIVAGGLVTIAAAATITGADGFSSGDGIKTSGDVLITAAATITGGKSLGAQGNGIRANQVTVNLAGSGALQIEGSGSGIHCFTLSIQSGTVNVSAEIDALDLARELSVAAGTKLTASGSCGLHSFTNALTISGGGEIDLQSTRTDPMRPGEAISATDLTIDFAGRLRATGSSGMPALVVAVKVGSNGNLTFLQIPEEMVLTGDTGAPAMQVEGTTTYPTGYPASLQYNGTDNVYNLRRPMVTAQPQNTSTPAGKDATFGVKATGATLYQWQKSTDGGTLWQDIAGATGATLTLQNVQQTDSGSQYRCEMDGIFYTDAATLTVLKRVAGVALLPKAQTLAPGDTLQLAATVSPADAADKTVRYSSGNTAVATVSAAGLVTAIAPGEAIITATTADGGFTDSATITVAAAPVPVRGVALDKTSLSLTAGASAQLAATVSPQDAADKAVSWRSSDPAVASVDQNGKVTAHRAGTATITATTANGGFTATATVTVTAAPVPVRGVALDKATLSLTAGASAQLAATVSPQNATNPAVSWRSSDPAVASVDQNGTVTAHRAGTVTITATTADGGFTATATVTVTAVPAPEPTASSVPAPVTGTTSPQTGDTAHPALWLCLAALALACVGGLLLWRRRVAKSK